MNPYLIRTKVQNTDIDIVKTILTSTGSFYDYEIDVAIELVEENITNGALKSGYNFIFLENEEKSVLGYACYGPIPCTKNSFDLYWIAVRKENWGKKIGSLLLTEVEKEVILKQGKRIYIETSSKDNYESTRIFYLKNKYDQESLLKDFYDDFDDKITFSKKF